MVNVMSFWDEWSRRFERHGNLFGDFDRFIEEMEKEMAESFKNMEEEMPENLFRERRLPDGSIRKEYGPFVYGYSVRIGPDGKPLIREFGNMKPRLEGKDASPFNLQDKREPLVDVIEEDDSIRVMAELPGVEKADIQLFATSEGLTISVDKPQKKYYKELKLPVEIEDSSAKSTYVNGVLEVVFKKKKNVKKGTRIEIK
jgi:HSP20 family protein